MTGRTATSGDDRPTALRAGGGDIGGPGAQPGEVDALLWMVTYQRALAIVSRKWVVGIVRALEHGPRRQFQIRMEIKGIQLKVLRDTLRTLEKEDLVEQVIMREDTGTGVGWALTATGQSLIEPIAAIFRWGRDHLDQPSVIDLDAEAHRTAV